MVFRTEEGRLYHIGAKFGEVNPHVLVPGSRVRVKKIAEKLKSPKTVSDGRFLMINGEYDGMSITAIDTGIGPSSAAIVVRELIEAIDFDKHRMATLIRPGTSGSLQSYVKVGDLVVSTGCIAQEEVSKRIIGHDFPLSADPGVVLALVEAGKKNGYLLGENLRVGVHHVKDALYEVEDSSLSATPGMVEKNLDYLKRVGALCTAMEFSVMSALAAKYNARWRKEGRDRRIRVGAVLLVLSPTKEAEEEIEFHMPSEEGLITTALDALVAVDRYELI